MRSTADACARTLRACAQYGIEVTAPGDPSWPTRLPVLGAAAPLVLFSQGDVGLLARPLHAKVAVVGSRAATQYGEYVAQQTAVHLSAQGDTVVSGGAYGIDAAAHRGALTGPGSTVAVLAGGLDRYYPAGNTTLLAQVARHGAVVSEAPPGVVPSRARFLQRNRIVAATCGLTVVVEAAYRSGSLDTLYRAHRLGRTVAAFPQPGHLRRQRRHPPGHCRRDRPPRHQHRRHPPAARPDPKRTRNPGSKLVPAP